ncbi:MAG: ATP-binding protein [Planctomycetes bacterium]|nr:ATP-binding protein [Planctomycetota bacterium]
MTIYLGRSNLSWHSPGWLCASRPRLAQMQEFIGRSQELKALEVAYAAPGSQFIPVYGRRRVGKSELILRFLEGKPSLYFLGKRGPAQLQLKEFLATAARALGQPLLASLAPNDWKAALAAAMEHRTRGRKFVLVLDEFQWTAQASPELPSVLQELWDLHWRKQGEIHLILCGSYLGFMEREVLGQGSPLFGRRTAQILVKPFNYLEAAEFHPRWSVIDKAKAYFLCGGIPLYLRFFSPADSIRTNIENNFLSEFAALYREPDFLLREELRELEKYCGILMAMAGGRRRAADIAEAAGVSERNLGYYLDQLVDLGYVARRFPLAGARPPARSVQLVIADPLLRFWFRFIYPNTSFIAQAGPRRSFQDVIQPELESYFGGCFERLCREALPYLYEREGVSGVYEVGEHWDRDVQIDVVGRRKDGWIDVGECKWGRVRSLVAVLRELEERVARVPNPGDLTVQGRLFTQHKLRGVNLPAGVRLHALEELYRTR